MKQQFYDVLKKENDNGFGIVVIIKIS